LSQPKRRQPLPTSWSAASVAPRHCQNRHNPQRGYRLTVDAHHRDLLRNALVHQRFRRLAGGDDNPGDAKLGETAQGARQILLAANFAHQRLKTAALDLAKQSIKQGCCETDR
jgi:hypothetical protein